MLIIFAYATQSAHLTTGMKNNLVILSLLSLVMLRTYGNNADAAVPVSGTTIDSATELFNEISGKYSTDMPDREIHECAASYLRLSDMYFRCGYYSNAFISASTALRIAEERGFNDLLAPAYNNLGKIYCTWRDFSLGAKYFIKGLDAASPETDPDTYRALIINIQGVYLNMDRPDDAKPYYIKMQGLTPLTPAVEYFLTLNEGLFLMADKDSARAREHFHAAAAIAATHDFDPSMLCSTYEYLGDAFNGRDSTLYYWKKAVELPGIPAYLRLGLLKKLHDLLRRRGDSGLATQYGDMYMSLSDSLFEMGEINRVKDFQLSYENEKRIRRINELDADKRERDIRLANQRRLINFTLAALLVFLTMTVILYIQRHRLRQAYLDLFRRNKETIDSQRGFERREKELQEKIAELRNQIEVSEKDSGHTGEAYTPTAADTPTESETGARNQSVHKLTEEKRETILAAIEKVLGDEQQICRTDFSIDVLAELTGHNTRYVSHIVNERYGCNFRTLLNNIRMDIARRRIIDVQHYGHLTIQAIAESLGYKSNSGFVQLFRKYTGVTPSMFQKMARDEQQEET